MIDRRLIAALTILGVAPLAASDWRVAAIDGADIRSIAIAPDDPDLVVAGSAAGHVYLSRDGGATWGDAGAPVPLPGYVVGVLAFDPHDPGRLWTALHGVWGSGTVASSDDLGKTWVARGSGLPEEPMYALAFDPVQPGHLFTGTLSGVWATTDGGASWFHRSWGHPLVRNVSSLWIDPERPLTIVAGTFRRAYKSDDAGATWRGVFEGMELDSQVFSMSGPGNDLWASTCGWVYRSSDRGEHWQRFKEGLAERRTPSFRQLPDGRLLAGTTGGLYMSIDRGRSWHRRTDADVVVDVIAVHPERGDRIFLGTEGGGVYRSTDAGATFAPSSRGMSNLRISGILRMGGDILVAVRDAGPVSGVFRSRDGGRTFEHESRTVPRVLMLHAYQDTALALTEQGLYTRAGVVWRKIDGFAGDRVLDVALPATPSDRRLVVTTEKGVYQGAPPSFTQVLAAKESAVSAASWGPAIWLSTPSGLLRFLGKSREGVSAPFFGGRLVAAGPCLVYTGSGGLFVKRDASGSWEAVTKTATRVLPTGSADLPLLLIHGDVVELYDPLSAERHAVELHVPARDVTSALLDGESLWLGTSGYGLLRGKSPISVGNMAGEKKDPGGPSARQDRAKQPSAKDDPGVAGAWMAHP